LRKKKVEKAVVEFDCVRCGLKCTVRFRGYPGQSRMSMFRRCWVSVKETYEGLGWRKLEEGWVCGRCTGIRGALFKKAVAEDVRKIQQVIEKLTEHIDAQEWETIHVSYATLALVGMSIGLFAENEEELNERVEFAVNDIRELSRRIFDSTRDEEQS
jgi:hypothetical protein